MPLKIIRQDITKIECDAIVNPSNRYLEAGGGADLAIHEAAGPELDAFCEQLGGCDVGKAKISPAFRLPCKIIIHTAGPRWSIRNMGAHTKLLESCYRECLRLAIENNCESIALPLISAGTYGFPHEVVLKIATKVIQEFLFENEMLIYLVVYDNRAFKITEKLFCDISSYIDDNYVDAHSEDYLNFPQSYSQSIRPFDRKELRERRAANFNELQRKRVESAEAIAPAPCASAPAYDSDLAINACEFQACKSICVDDSIENIDDIFKNMDKGFAETLFYYIDEKGITDVECYKRSNVDKKTFSKIKCNKNHKPSKKTAVSFAIGLRLNLAEANHLLSTAGMCLSHSEKFDLIIEYFLKTGNYKDIFEVNEILYKFDQSLLGV